MGDGNTFLKYFITEDIYVIDVPKESEKQADSTIVEEPKAEYQESKKPKVVHADTCVVLNKIENKENGMLQKLLAAIEVSKPDYVDQLNLQSGHKNYLIFGDFLDKEKYVIHEIEEVRILISDDVEQLNTDESLKRKLWTQLQKMFLKV